MEYFNRLKDEIIRKYLKEQDLHEAKKNAIRDVLKQSGKEIEKLTELNQDDFIMQLKENCLKNTIDIINLIIKFKRISILKDLHTVCKPSYDYKYYGNAFILYYRLENFFNLGISPDNYLNWYNSLLKTASELQLYSSIDINLDCIPMHPADTIREFYFVTKNSKFTLEIANIILSGLGKDEYKKMPSATKQEKALRKYIEIRNKLSLKERKSVQKPFIQSGHIKIGR